MNGFEPRDPDFEARVRASFARQPFMEMLGAELVHLVPGEVDIVMPYRIELTQQHGYFHAGSAVSIADSAAGYAAMTLYRPGTGILTTEFKVNLLDPAKGDRLVARGRVIKPGRTLTVCRSDVFAEGEAEPVHVVTALFTMMQLEGLDN